MDKIQVKPMNLEDAKKLGIDTWSEWSCEASTFDWYYDESETCYVLEGDVIVTTTDEKVHIKENMLATFPKGLECTWEVRRPLKKLYTFNFQGRK